MIRYLIRRLIAVVLLLAAVLVVTFVIFFAIGSNPALRECGKICTPAKLQAIEHVLGTDKSKPKQFEEYAKGLFVGRTFDAGTSQYQCPAPCLGISYVQDLPVRQLIDDRFGVTFSLALGSSILWLFAGVVSGMYSALKAGTRLDRGILAGATVSLSIPVQLVGYALLYIVCVKGHANYPTYVNFKDNPLQWAHNLILPWITLAFISAATYTRLMRTQMMDALQDDYIRTARGKGVPDRTVAFRHALRAAFPPIIIVFGLDVGALLGGAVITEDIFGLPGLGKLFITSVVNLDFPIVVGVTLFGAFFVLIANLIVDVIYALTDPKIVLS